MNLRQLNFRQLAQFMLGSAALLTVLCLLADVASACPTCKEGVIGQQKNMANGYAWSIMLMMAMPFTLLSLLGGYFYYEIRRARKAQSATDAKETLAAPSAERTVLSTTDAAPADVKARA